MKARLFASAVLCLVVVLPMRSEGAIVLGTSGNFAVLAGSTVTNTGPTAIIGGDVGVGPGSAITGFPPGIIAAPNMTHAGDAVAIQALNDLTQAYNSAAALTPTQALTGQNLGGLVLNPGVYFFSSSALLTGTLTLNNQGDPNAIFVFQVGSTLTTASNSSIVTINGGPPLGSNVFFQVGTSATLGANTAFEGHILANTSITLNTGATILNGSALARNGAVVLDTNRITNGILPSAVPEPSTMTLALMGVAFLGLPTLRGRLNGRRARHESRPDAGMEA